MDKGRGSLSRIKANRQFQRFVPHHRDQVFERSSPSLANLGTKNASPPIQAALSPASGLRQPYGSRHGIYPVSKTEMSCAATAAWQTQASELA
jgi:hypothetical protein